MERLLAITTGLAIVLIIAVLFSVRRQHIRPEYSVSWLGAAFALLILSRSKTLLTQLAHLMRIENPPVALMLVAGCLFVLVFYRFSVIISALKDANISLAQRVAILEYRLQAVDGKETRPAA
jgi:hypothetical protein